MSRRLDADTISLFLVVIGVVFLLWILFPTQPNTREAARRTSCVSNVKQLGMAVTEYIQDYDGNFPPKARWCDRLTSYLKNVQVLACPSAKDQRSGYAYYVDMPLTKGACRDPQHTVMMFDAIAGWNTVGNAGIAALRHQGMLNVGFVDGHVKSYSALPNTISPTRNGGQ